MSDEWSSQVDEAGGRVVARVQSPRGELALRRRGDVYEIISNGMFLMDSSDGRSERMLAALATQQPVPHTVVVAGLGVGFTLAEVLRRPEVEAVTVIEIEDAIVSWNRGPLADVNGHALEDPRVNVVVADFLDWISATDERFDAVCLDIDNGPDWTVTEANRLLYSTDNLDALRHRLAAGGRLAVWGAASSPAFESRLSTVFGEVERHECPTVKGLPDVIWLAESPR